jgi:outer membrane receptor protein involved in Fe transport
MAVACVAQPAMAQASPSAPAADASPPSDNGPADIIVTAQKTEQNINKVPMSITAVTAYQLRSAGVTEIRDLVKITPGLTYADSQTGSPVYTIRGVGFSDFALAGRPTVTVYNDQAPLPFSIETRGVNLDLERVEVLKGPQGTLFGTNSTGGAINFIAAKPTSEFDAGGDLSYGRFNSNQISGFVSGPITSTLRGRLAVQHDGMDAWQVNPANGEKLGVQDFWNGRLTLDWAPTDKFQAILTVNRWIDHSDTQAQQFIAYAPSFPGATVPQLAAQPTAPANNRAAGWDAGRSYRKDNNFIQTNLRMDYELSDIFTLTSLTSYSRYRENQLTDLDGTIVNNSYFQTIGKIRSISEEFRVSAAIADKGHVIIGGYYADDKSSEIDPINSPVSSVSAAFGVPVNFKTTTSQGSTTKAVFGSFDYDIIPSVNIYGGIRYTDFHTDFTGCTGDSGDGVVAPLFGIQPGECFTVTEAGVPGFVNQKLRQDNVSWRAGAQWTIAPRAMLYANVSKGYKAGSFPILPANSYVQLNPVNQESLLAYEAGFKVGLFNRALQINGAVFHYDYTDKQVLGYDTVILNGAPFQVLRLINVPKSRVNGAELDLTAVPLQGLRLTVAGTYVDTRITRSPATLQPDPLGTFIDFKGQSFPNTPKWQLSSDAEYKWSATDKLTAFLGGNVSYQSRTNSGFGNLELFRTKAYALLDLRAGIESGDGRWRATIWGRNVTNTYYWTATTHAQDAVVRFAGQPATYGVSLSFRYR